MEVQKQPVPYENGKFKSTSELTSHIELENNGSAEKLEVYVPADHRDKSVGNSNLGTLINLLKVCLGSGILAMPLAFQKSGVIPGLIGVILVGAICTHGISILVKTSQEICAEIRRPALGYAETCYLVFERGPKPVRMFAGLAREVADWGVLATHLGSCCMYIVVISKTFQQISDQYGGPQLSIEIYCAMCLLIFIPLAQISKLKYLVPFSMLANGVWLVSISICLYYCLKDAPPVSERALSTSVSSWPLFLSTSLFAMEGIGIIMPLENEMKSPKRFTGCPGVLNTAMAFVVVMYGFVGFSGYLRYGDETTASLPLNLPQDEKLAQAAKIMVALALVFSYLLVFYAPVEIVWDRIQSKLAQHRRWLAMSGIRLAGVLITVSIAAALPKLELIVEFLGAVFLSTLGLFVPAVLETIWRWNRGLGCCYWIAIKNILIMLFSILTLVTGVATSINAVMQEGSK